MQLLYVAGQQGQEYVYSLAKEGIGVANAIKVDIKAFIGEFSPLAFERVKERVKGR